MHWVSAAVDAGCVSSLLLAKGELSPPDQRENPTRSLPRSAGFIGQEGNDQFKVLCYCRAKVIAA